MDVQGKAALVTGGTRGIGAAAAVQLAGLGADVAIVGREAGDAARATKALIEEAGRRCTILTADLARPEEATRCVNETRATLGGLDILVHCAGATAAGSLLEVDEALWYQAFDVHVHAIFHLCRAAVPLMKTKGTGAIVLISSIAGVRGCLGALAYGVVKGAIPQFTRGLARELADANISVNCVTPGVIRTRLQDYLTPEQVKHNLANRIPLHREGQPEDVARIISTLVTNDYVTGENITIDGGLTMRIA